MSSPAGGLVLALLALPAMRLAPGWGAWAVRW
jgi:hypothetical protein